MWTMMQMLMLMNSKQSQSLLLLLGLDRVPPEHVFQDSCSSGAIASTTTKMVKRMQYSSLLSFSPHWLLPTLLLLSLSWQMMMWLEDRKKFVDEGVRMALAL